MLTEGLRAKMVASMPLYSLMVVVAHVINFQNRKQSYMRVFSCTDYFF